MFPSSLNICKPKILNILGPETCLCPNRSQTSCRSVGPRLHVCMFVCPWLVVYCYIFFWMLQAPRIDQWDSAKPLAAMCIMLVHGCASMCVCTRCKKITKTLHYKGTFDMTYFLLKHKDHSENTARLNVANTSLPVNNAVRSKFTSLLHCCCTLGSQIIQITTGAASEPCFISLHTFSAQQMCLPHHDFPPLPGHSSFKWTCAPSAVLMPHCL